MEAQITKYGKAEYGYGFEKFSDPFSPYHHLKTDVVVYAPSKTGAHIEKLVEFYRSYNHTIDIYIVYDNADGTWKEYFTGISLKEPDFKIRLDVKDTVNVDEYTDTHFENVPYLHRTPNCHFEYTSTQFAEEISKLGDGEIREYVAKLNKVINDGKRWRDGLVKCINEVREERKRKESGVSDTELKINNNFGLWQKGLEMNAKALKSDEEIRKERMSKGLCSYCGGGFKGVFNKVCRRCGRAKNY